MSSLPVLVQIGLWLYQDDERRPAESTGMDPVEGSPRNHGHTRLQVMGGDMDIKWRHDIDQVLSDARTQRKPVLLDFSAAPM